VIFEEPQLRAARLHLMTQGCHVFESSQLGRSRDQDSRRSFPIAAVRLRRSAKVVGLSTISVLGRTPLAWRGTAPRYPQHRLNAAIA